MANITTSAPFAAIERGGAQQTASGASSAIDQVVVQLRPGAGSGQGITEASSELAEIIQLASQVVGNLSGHPTEEAEQSAKVLGVTAAVVLVVVAVVVAVFTFGAGAALVGLAVIAAASAIGGVVAVGQGAGFYASSALGTQLATLLGPAQAAVRNFEANRGRDAAAARSRALREILKAMRELQRLAPQTERLTGPCLGDPPASYGALQRLLEALLKLIAALRQIPPTGGSGGRETTTALEALHATLIKASQNLRPLSRPRP